tara:strand:+ start:103 stop:393 length:291 start_codon:yes stop_codon:yes gene_type:complete
LKKKLLDILACPIDKQYPLELVELDVRGEVVVNGVLLCSKCSRFYPIIDEIPIMLPDELRNKADDLSFLEKWVTLLPKRISYDGRPVNLKKRLSQA